MKTAIFAFTACFAYGASAQTASAPDVSITATVTARQLRFEQVPQVTVTFTDQTANVWKTDRNNLPDQVQPYVTYRDIGIRLTITSTLPDIEKIVDEALAGPAPSIAAKRKRKR